MPRRPVASAARAQGKLRPRPLRPALRHLGLLGLSPETMGDLLAEVERGLAFPALEAFKATTGLSWDALCALVQIPPRTLTRRRAAGRLDSAESDRLIRAARLFEETLSLFEGDAEAARGWLVRPQRGLGGATPLDFARTETGAREVEQLIGRLEHGVPT